MTSDKRAELLEHFANIEHARWSKWQAYMHSKCVEYGDGKGEWVCFPAELYKRWERQINTPYAELSESEKESDREQVRPYLDYFTKHHQDMMSAVDDEAWSATQLLWNRIAEWQKEWEEENPEERALVTQDALKLIEWKIAKVRAYQDILTEQRVKREVVEWAKPKWDYPNQKMSDMFNGKVQFNEGYNKAIKDLETFLTTTSKDTN